MKKDKNAEDVESKDIFRKFSEKMSKYIGSVWALIAGLTMILTVILLEIVFINNKTLMVTIAMTPSVLSFLLLFFIQNTQTRNDDEIRVKLTEILEKVNGKDELKEMDDMTEEEVDEEEE